jgi:protein TonB
VRTGFLVAASLAGHLGVFALVTKQAKEIERKQTSIEVFEQKKKDEQKKLEPPPRPIEAPAEVLKRPAPAPSPVAPAEPVVNDAPSKAMNHLPDVGNVAPAAGAGGGGGGDGPPGGGSGGAGGKGGGGGGGPTEKTLTRAPASNDGGDLAAEIKAWKPRPRARVKPVYPDDARSAEIEGTVAVEAVIDCTGKVTSARVVTSLGHGLDAAALTAIQKTEFDPAPRCATGFQKTVKINYAFRLGD